MRLLHLMHDEKFIDDAIYLFEKVNAGNNIYLVEIPYNGYKLKYIKSDSIIPLVKKSSEYEKILLSSSFDVVFSHGLNNSRCESILAIKRDVTIVWALFGFEYYGSKFYNQKLFLKHTNRLLFLSGLKLRNFVGSAIRKTKQIFRGKFYTQPLFELACAKVDYCAAPIREEVDLFKKTIPTFKGDFISFRYGALELDFKEYLDTDFLLGENIFVGNSSSPTCNHLDVFNLLNQYKLKNKKIVVPLNYGNNNYYVKHVSRYGSRYFGENFSPIYDFLPKDKYITDVLSSCNVAILNHQRQQGLGNIILIIWMGLKLYLSENNLIFIYLKRIGITVYSIENEFEIEHLNNGLDQETIAKNKSILYQYFGIDNILYQMKNMVIELNLNGDRRSS